MDHQGSRIKSEETVLEASTYDLEMRRMTPLFTFISRKEDNRHCYLAYKLMNEEMMNSLGEPFKPNSVMSGNNIIYKKGSINVKLITED